MVTTHSAIALEVPPVSRLFKALGDETRLRIVALLSHGELCVCHVQEALALGQPNASRQLGILRNAGVVDSRRAGSWTYYRLAAQLDVQCRRPLRSPAGTSLWRCSPIRWPPAPRCWRSSSPSAPSPARTSTRR